MESEGPGTCPFCDYKATDAYMMIHHVEIHHPENGQSPFDVCEDNGSNGATDPTVNCEASIPGSNVEVLLSAEDAIYGDIYYLDCPVGCGHKVFPEDLSVHLDFHYAESAAFEENGSSDLAADHVSKVHEDYEADASLEVAKKMEQDLHAYEDDFTVAPKGGGRKHRRRRRHSKSSKPSKKTAHSQGSGKYSVWFTFVALLVDKTKVLTESRQPTLAPMRMRGRCRQGYTSSYSRKPKLRE